MRVLCVMILAAAATPAVHGAVVEVTRYNDANCTESFICDVNCNVPREEAQDIPNAPRGFVWRERINGTDFEKWNATCKNIGINNDVCDALPYASHRISCKEDDWEESTSVSRIDVCFLNETCHLGLNEHALNQIKFAQIQMNATVSAEELLSEFIYLLLQNDFLPANNLEEYYYDIVTIYDRFCIYVNLPIACSEAPISDLCEANNNSTMFGGRHNSRATCREISPATATPSFTPTSTQSLTQTSTPTSTQSSTPTSTYTTSTSTTSTTTTTTVFEKSRRVHMFVPIVATGGFVLAFVGSALA